MVEVVSFCVYLLLSHRGDFKIHGFQFVSSFLQGLDLLTLRLSTEDHHIIILTILSRTKRVIVAIRTRL